RQDARRHPGQDDGFRHLQEVRPRHPHRPARVMTDAVLLHPYFAHGGDQHNRVISAIYDRLLGTAVKPHRFDFSPVGESGAQAGPGARMEGGGGPVLLIGSWFGGAVAATILHPAVAGWALIAPALAVPQFISPATPFHPPKQPPIGTDPRPKL